MKKALVFILAMLMIITSVSYSFATDMTEQPAENIEPQIIEEDISKRGEFEKHFLQSDGTYIAVSYAQPVHRETSDGVFEEIDNSLSLNDGRLENADESFKVSFAEKSEKELVKISYDRYTMSWGLSSFTDRNNLPADEADENAFVSARAEKQAKIFNNSEELESFSANERKMLADKISSELVYNGILGDGIDARYSLTPGRVKEDIILNSPLDFAGYAMGITVEGLTAAKTEENSVEFANDDGDVIFILSAPYMYDAADDISFDIEINVEETEEGYRVTFTPNAEWLNADERVYPIVIDPTVTVDQAVVNGFDTFVWEGAPNTSQDYLKDRTFIGKYLGYKARTFQRFDIMPNIPNGSTFISAEQTFTIPAGTSSGAYASAWRVTEKIWTSSALHWNNQPIADTSIPITGNNISQNGNFASLKLNMLATVKAWYNSDSTGKTKNFGVMIRYNDESVNDYNSFYSADCTTTAYRPKLTIVYDSPAPQGYPKNGWCDNIATLNIRSSMSTSSSSNILTVIVKGTKMTITDQPATDWYSVTLANGTKGYAWASYISFNNPGTTLVMSPGTIKYFPQTSPKNYSIANLNTSFTNRIRDAGCFACSIAMALTNINVKTTSNRYDHRTGTSYQLSPDPVTVCFANLNFPSSNPTSSPDPVYMYSDRVAGYFGTTASGFTSLDGLNESTKKAQLKTAIDASNNNANRSPIIIRLNNGSDHYVLVTGYIKDSNGTLIDLIINDPVLGNGGINRENVSFADTHRGVYYSNIKSYIYFTKN